MPLEARVETWGDEIYFDIGLALPAEAPREVVEAGDLGYWPPGRAFCVFFGPTPMSRGDEIRPASAVTVVGRCVDDPLAFYVNPSPPVEFFARGVDLDVA